MPPSECIRVSLIVKGEPPKEGRPKDRNRCGKNAGQKDGLGEKRNGTENPWQKEEREKHPQKKHQHKKIKK